MTVRLTSCVETLKALAMEGRIGMTMFAVKGERSALHEMYLLSAVWLGLDARRKPTEVVRASKSRRARHACTHVEETRAVMKYF